MDNDNNFFLVTLILENVKLNIMIINSLKEHFKTLLSSNIIFSNRFNEIMEKLKFLNNESNSQLKLSTTIERIFLVNEIDNNLLHRLHMPDHLLHVYRRILQRDPHLGDGFFLVFAFFNQLYDNRVIF